MILIPEIIIHNSLKKLIAFIRDDYQLNIADTTKSLLYRLLGADQVGRYSLFTESVALLINDASNPRHLDINMFFNAKRAAIPTIHITLPSESEKNNSMANGEGFGEPIYDTVAGTYINVYNRRFTSRTNIIITSDNTNEVILLYHLVKNLLISLNGHFNVSGLNLPKLSGGDIQINQELIPVNIFTRSIGMEYEYDVEAQDLFKLNINTLDIIGTSVTPIIT
jgi:hypothetical protein